MTMLAEKSADYRFVEAADYLKNLPSGPSDGFRQAMLSLAESSADFLSDLENDLRVREVSEPVNLKSGGVLVGLKVDETGNLRDATGRLVDWVELSPDALIGLHRYFVRNPENEAERLRRHACAIAFDWLAGDRERATAAAARLASESPDFKNQWDKVTAGLPE
jgi:eukaryotic-like serine/threonine-protein kinase